MITYAGRAGRFALAEIGNYFNQEYWSSDLCMTLCATVNTKLIIISQHHNKALWLRYYPYICIVSGRSLMVVL
jgi:hypothetical protein